MLRRRKELTEIRFKFDNGSMYIKRAISPVLLQACRQFPAVLVTGPRQSGKTTLLQEELGPLGYAFVSFDDPVVREFAQADPNGFLDGYKDKALVLDEVQYVPGLFSYLKVRIDARRTECGRFVLTGSQQFQMMRNVSDSLAGRVAVLELLPFALEELGDRVAPTTAEQIWRGGYPPVVLNPEVRELWLRSYLSTYLERDVRQLQNIRDLGQFQSFLTLCAAAHGQELNLARLSRDCGISQPGARQWLGVLTASYIVLLVPPYHSNLGKRAIKSPKLYFVDSALAAELTRQPSAAALWTGPVGGAFFEGWVVTETIKFQKARAMRADIYFWRSHDGLEVDLIIESRGRLHAIEIKQTATPSLHHLGGLRRFRNLVGDGAIGSLVLVCNVREPTPLPDQVKAIPWHGWPRWMQENLRE
jgi:predicted AAA+ superfamily ATPase